jgi:peptidoglycan/LPS O-acetylase OafA/YrhL
MSTSAVVSPTLELNNERDDAGSHRFYRPELDSLRFFAFLLVFCRHSLYAVAGLGWLGRTVRHVSIGGAFGVDLFFILSAYLITELLRRERAATGSIAVRAFYVRRLLRIWPLYFIFLAFCFFTRHLAPPPATLPNPAVAAYALFAGNWYMAYVASHVPFISPMAPLWSVSVEEQFYLIWPLVVRMCRHRQLLAIAVIICGLSLIIQAILFHAQWIFHAIWFNSFVHAGAIGIGIISALVLEGRVPTIRPIARILMLCGGAALLAVAHGWFHFENTYSSPVMGIAAFGCGIGGACTLFYAFLGAPQDGPKLFRWRPFVYLGRISYGLYVFHVAALELVKYVALRSVGRCPPWERFSVALPITIILAWLSYRWLETPFLRFKDRLSIVKAGPCEY